MLFPSRSGIGACFRQLSTMHHEDSPSGNLARAVLELCSRPPAPLSPEEQRRRYRHRRGLPDWFWGVLVGLLVSAALVVAFLLTQKN